MAMREPLIFALLLSGAAGLMVSIALGQTLLGAALGTWLIWRPRSPYLPSWFVPMCVFIALTFVSLALSPDPAVNWAFRKTSLFAMALMAATFVTTQWRARTSIAVLLAVATITSGVGLIQFIVRYVQFLSTQQLADNPTVLARITGLMSHWMTYSGEQLVVWCAAVPAIVVLGRKWLIPLTIVGAGIILSFTQSVWLGAAVAMAFVALMMPRRLVLTVALPLLLIVMAGSGLIYQRLSRSLTDPDYAPTYGRLELWKAGVQMVRENPLFGVGPERVSVEFVRIYQGPNLGNIYYGHLENNFLQIAAERGLICFAAFLWFIFELYAGLFRLMKIADEALHWTVLSGLAALTGFIVAGFFQYNFGDSEILLLLLFIVGIPFGVLHEPIESRS